MDIKTLESFRLSDAISFHDELNPKLWHGMDLRPEVRKQLKKIADDFMDELGISGLDVVDVTVSGSNAAYSYTPHSDLDLHIIVDMSDMPNDEVYKELFNAKKNIYNDSHDITIHGVPIEVYVQDASEPVVSLGEYSIKDNDWIKLPTKRRANLDQTATRSKYNKLLDKVNTALKSNNLKKINKTIKKIRQYRQAGLDKGGEFGPENLAYKVLRSQGYITKLYQLRDKLHSEVLTIETMYQNPEQLQELDLDGSQQFAAEKTPAINPYGGLKDRQYRGGISEAFDQPYPIKWEKTEHGDYDAMATLPDGKPLTIMFDHTTPYEVTITFWRNNNLELTGEGDSQRVFATVLQAIQEFLKIEQPANISFSASKEVEPGQKAMSRSSLYDKLVKRYAQKWGYDAQTFDHGEGVEFNLTRKQNVAEASGYIPSEKEKNDPRFKTALTVDVRPNTMKKDAKKFGNKISRAGIPPTANPNGKF